MRGRAYHNEQIQGMFIKQENILWTKEKKKMDDATISSLLKNLWWIILFALLVIALINLLGRAAA